MENLLKAFLLVITLFTFSCETEFEEQFCPSLKDCIDPNATTGLTYTQFFFDDFNRANEPALLAPWNHITGTAADKFSLQTNVLVPNATGVEKPSAMYNTSVNNLAVRVTATGTVTNAGLVGGEILVLLRSQSSINIDNSYFCGIDPGGGTVAIGKRVATVVQPAFATSAGAFVLNLNDSFVIQFTAVNSNLTCTITENGVTSHTATGTDTAFTTGFAGVRGGNNNADEVSFDNFTIETADP